VTGVAVTNNSTGGWNTPSTDLINTYEAGDKRLDASIGIVEGTYNGSDLFVYSAVKSIVGYVPAAGKIGVPYIKKYLLNTFTINTGSSVNFPIYRYADALLLLAEAQNEQGKAPLTALNAVRVRAGLTASNSADQGVLRTLIAHERRVELAFENHRWHDLVRSGNAISVINAFGVTARAQMPYLASDAYVVDSHDLLFPIPQGDRGLNPALTQNPGYF
ncbi:MAG: RagB/SusD family nutrient uptake outer membrane protein, partial [Pedobacter sp.]|nr:RagB/SusD family nutrient uptake outer membrane protein [Pedobacter sp.]